MKYKILDIYNARLDERIKRKQFVIERDLLDFNKQSQIDKSRTQEEREIHNLMKVFARFNTPEDHEKIVQGIIKEKKLRIKIEELNFYKKLGLKNFQEVEVTLIIMNSSSIGFPPLLLIRTTLLRSVRKTRNIRRGRNRMKTTSTRPPSLTSRLASEGPPGTCRPTKRFLVYKAI